MIFAFLEWALGITMIVLACTSEGSIVWNILFALVALAAFLFGWAIYRQEQASKARHKGL
jgi:hypothetical protein